MAVPARALVVALAIVVLGCTPTSSPTSSNRTSPPGSGGPGGRAAFHAATDLEAKLPAQAGQVAVTRESVLGTGFRAVRQNHAGLRCRWYAGGIL